MDAFIEQKSEEEKKSQRPKRIVDILSEMNLDVYHPPREVENMVEEIHQILLSGEKMSYHWLIDEIFWRQLPARFSFTVSGLLFEALDSIPPSVVVVPWSSRSGLTWARYLDVLKDTRDISHKSPFPGVLDSERIFLLVYDGISEGEVFEEDMRQTNLPVVFLEARSRNLTGSEKNVAEIRTILGSLDEAVPKSLDVEEHIKAKNETISKARIACTQYVHPFKHLPRRLQILMIYKVATLFPVTVFVFMFVSNMMTVIFQDSLAFLNIDASKFPVLFPVVFLCDFFMAGVLICLGQKWMSKNTALSDNLILTILASLRICAIILYLSPVIFNVNPEIVYELTPILFFDLVSPAHHELSVLIFVFKLRMYGLFLGWFAVKNGWKFW
ncbi:MAG: hypothetical protein GX130_07895 [Candidatus Hydrogenedens sp.]|jgi:hypothetical protein|nr:hypothetical protein [Candidatus Hydrogenedens sp.]